MKKRSDYVKVAYEKGYRVIGGEVYSHLNRKRKLSYPDKYLRFNFYHPILRKGCSVLVHRLVAYQKYGDQILNADICVRHLDGNSLNNNEDNIVIGTAYDNCMDRPITERVAHCYWASSFLRRFSNAEEDEIRAFYNEVRSYKMVMEKYNIKSCSLVFKILHHRKNMIDTNRVISETV